MLHNKLYKQLKSIKRLVHTRAHSDTSNI